MKISVIIPVFNEETYIKSTLNAVFEGKNIEIIIVDGGSSDQTVAIASSFSPIILIHGEPGRSQQMNLGASKATGEILLFLHGDSRLPSAWDLQIRQAFQKPDILTGAFKFKVDFSTLSMKIIEQLVAFRSLIFHLPYGDQGIFIRSSTFQELGGFVNAPIMEDYELMKQVRKKGKIKILNSPVITSGRRWKSGGVIRTTLMNQCIIIAYRLGVSPHRLRSWYKKNSNK